MLVVEQTQLRRTVLALSQTKHVAPEGFAVAQQQLENAVLRPTCVMKGCARHSRQLRVRPLQLRAHNRLEFHRRCR